MRANVQMTINYSMDGQFMSFFATTLSNHNMMANNWISMAFIIYHVDVYVTEKYVNCWAKQ